MLLQQFIEILILMKYCYWVLIATITSDTSIMIEDTLETEIQKEEFNNDSDGLDKNAEASNTSNTSNVEDVPDTADTADTANDADESHEENNENNADEAEISISARPEDLEIVRVMFMN